MRKTGAAHFLVLCPNRQAPDQSPVGFGQIVIRDTWEIVVKCVIAKTDWGPELRPECPGGINGVFQLAHSIEGLTRALVCVRTQRSQRVDEARNAAYKKPDTERSPGKDSRSRQG